MAASSSFHLITLDENDVPGAKLVYPDVEQHSNVQLQRWLECRSVSKSGNRSQLINKVKSCISAGNDREIAIDVDGGKWYDKKLKQAKQSEQSESTTVPFFPLSGWGTFPSVSLPIHFNVGHIHHHIVESVQFIGTKTEVESDAEEEVEDVHTSKPMRKGKVYFNSGHVQSMKDCKKKDFYFLKAKVMASYKTDVLYDTTVTLSCLSGFVKDASCSCVASGMGRCNHVAALLFALLDYIERYGNEPAASTSLKCTWNVGRKRKKNPEKAQESVKKSGKKKKVHELITYDPRPPSLRVESPENSKRELLWGLGVNKVDKSMWGTILFREYEDFVLEDSEVDILKEQRRQLLGNLAVGQSLENSDPVLLVSDQLNENWFLHRRLRITASNAKVVGTVNEKTSVSALSNIVNKIMWDTVQVKSMATVYGQANESRARIEYIENMQTIKPTLTCSETGFWVNPEYPELGCSPDGLVFDEEEEDVHGLLEIKCPKILEDKDVLEFENHLDKGQISRFCLQRKDGEIGLKRSHQYYFQVQMQLGIMNRDWCDFVVWSSKSMVVERINIDKTFWESLKKKLISFHHQYICPEHFQMKIPRELTPYKLSP